MSTAAQTQTLAAKTKPLSTSTHAGLLLQRKCACGSPTASLTGECVECKSRKLVQTKLAMGASNDPLEQEADRVADQVLAAPTHSSVRGAPPHIQRFMGQATGQADTAPASVDHVLASPGRPLDPALRQDMEQRFGHDFAQVRVHTDTQSAASAQAVSAHAYTVGSHIVFDVGRFRPQSVEGSRLLAHELTHVLQQEQGPRRLQRWAACKPARMVLESGAQQDCPPRQPAEKQRARTGQMAFPSVRIDPISGEEGVLIANFDIGKAAIKSNLHSSIEWQRFLERIASNRSRLAILGFTDCEGDDGLNERLRGERAKEVFKILPTGVQSQVISHEGAAPYDCVTENNNAADRTLNRSVVLTVESSMADFDEEHIQPSVPTTEPDTDNCDKPQRDALARAFTLAKEMVRAAIDAIDDESLMKKYFGEDVLAHRSHIKENFRSILDGLNGGPTFECNEADSFFFCDEAHATVIPIVGLNIHICPSAIALGTDFLARTIVHECAHGFAFVFVPDELCAGGWPPSKDTTDAEDNADCYGEFAGDAWAKAP